MIPSIHQPDLLSGKSYAHYSAIPPNIACNPATNLVASQKPEPLSSNQDGSVEGTPCILGIDEAGRGPVIGPMVYSAFYLPSHLYPSLLTTSPNVFNDSKVVSPSVRAQLMQTLCKEGTDLYENCGWTIKSLSALSISEGMLQKQGKYSLNDQAMDATIEIVKGVLSLGVNIKEIYVDTLGPPVTHRQRLERIFPAVKIVVEKKADRLYPVVSAASVVAKVTRDVSCEILYKQIACHEAVHEGSNSSKTVAEEGAGWGSGYPSDTKCVTWMKKEINALFGWGRECRFSWSTAKEMLESTGKHAPSTKVDWPVDEDEETMRVTDFYSIGTDMSDSINGETLTEEDSLRTWYGSNVGQEAF